ncbi:hypothetical protein EMIHUDRAFT_121578 [Emiliania huxleyi CCMP1516]|uniref:Signal recognition particle receptor subunit beta n=2 Tax=Emiliania huxleyi TaxID=2903 RepID=A0A0D3I054_EMIH1|nr:hypothetical protein EMIHUDRAFT_121578 [Emiliania huxleyi CCMP1516]EOD04639.1 hypothetical protein EMIHUDRAFT_121578 [Emiliania huxleyi CCMP1516]|eukprot:XP_005757068.1 hypothetical protein EMIHUDRAFT_121578 [Emiliania huxleyi CCMP1516]
MPGYGFALASEAAVEAWARLSAAYLRKRSTIKLVLVLVDARVGLKPSDVQMLQFLEAEARLPYLVVLTKADAAGPPQRIAQVAALVQSGLKSARRQLRPLALVSSQRKAGVDALQRRIICAATGRSDLLPEATAPAPRGRGGGRGAAGAARGRGGRGGRGGGGGGTGACVLAVLARAIMLNEDGIHASEGSMIQQRQTVMTLCACQVCLALALASAGAMRRTPTLLVMQPFFVAAGAFGYFGARDCKPWMISSHFVGSSGLSLVIGLYIIAESFLKESGKADLLFFALNGPMDLFMVAGSFASLSLWRALVRLRRQLRLRRAAMYEQLEESATRLGEPGAPRRPCTCLDLTLAP